MSRVKHVGSIAPKIDPAWVAEQLGAEPMTPKEAEKYKEFERFARFTSNLKEDEQVERHLQILKKVGWAAGILFIMILLFSITSPTTGCRGCKHTPLEIETNCIESCKEGNMHWTREVIYIRGGLTGYTCICKEKK